MAKKGSKASYRNLLAAVIDANVAKQLTKDAKDRFNTRSSGYTRIVKLGKRSGDATEEVTMSFVDEIVPVEVMKQPESKTTSISKQKKSTKTNKEKK